MFPFRDIHFPVDLPEAAVWARDPKDRIWALGGLSEGPLTSNLTVLAVELAERGATEALEADRSAAEWQASRRRRTSQGCRSARNGAAGRRRSL